MSTSVADTWPELVAAEDTVEGVAGVWLAGAKELEMEMSMSENNDCSRCGGQGEIFIRKTADGKQEYVDCPVCNGTGKKP